MDNVQRLVALLGAVMGEQVSLERALEEEVDEVAERDYTFGGDGYVRKQFMALQAASEAVGTSYRHSVSSPA